MRGRCGCWVVVVKRGASKCAFGDKASEKEG